MSAYKVIEVIGTSENSWEEAAQNAVATAGHSLQDMRVAEVKELDMTVSPDGSVQAYRARVMLSFKYRSEE
ncbi:MAG: dodecin family protein [Ectothiorhodospiraceae bacterium]|jgi:flavin-binding protein dodecin